jgi:hypothetical protein
MFNLRFGNNSGLMHPAPNGTLAIGRGLDDARQDGVIAERGRLARIGLELRLRN